MATVGDVALTPYMVTPEVLNGLIKPAIIKIQKQLGGISLLYVCSKTEETVPFLIECGYDGISVDETVNIARIKPMVGDVRILRYISSKKTLVSGTPSGS